MAFDKMKPFPVCYDVLICRGITGAFFLSTFRGVALSIT